MDDAYELRKVNVPKSIRVTKRKRKRKQKPSDPDVDVEEQPAPGPRIPNLLRAFERPPDTIRKFLDERQEVFGSKPAPGIPDLTVRFEPARCTCDESKTTNKGNLSDKAKKACRHVRDNDKLALVRHFDHLIRTAEDEADRIALNIHLETWGRDNRSRCQQSQWRYDAEWNAHDLRIERRRRLRQIDQEWEEHTRTW